MVDILIVTYGNRWKYLEQVLRGLLSESLIRQITIVNNNSDYNVKQQINSFQSDKIVVLDLEKNFGSAYGFHFGFSYLLNQPRANLLMLLDDDNLPEKGCMEKMYAYWNTIEGKEKESHTMLLAMRPSRSYLKNAAKGLRTNLFFPLNNHFLGFNLFRPDIWLSKKIFPRTLKNKPDREFVSIPCAPYGGLFFHKKLLFKNGLPDKRFFTYADDFDFSYRNVKHNGNILLLPGCIVQDLDIPFVNKRSTGIGNAKFLRMDRFRLFYLMRNTMFFTKQYFITSRFIFAVNRFVYTGYLFILAIMYGKLKTFLLFNSAVSKGLQGDFENEPASLQKIISNNKTENQNGI